MKFWVGQPHTAVPKISIKKLLGVSYSQHSRKVSYRSLNKTILADINKSSIKASAF